MRSFHHVIKKVVAYDGSIHFLTEQVHDQHVAWLEHVDGQLIGQRPKTAFLGFGRGNLIYIWAVRHELNGECPSNHWFFRMQDLKSIGVLVAETFFFQNCPDFFRGKFPRSFYQIVRDLGTAVGETFEVALCRVVG